jgi:hypothetical protein
MRLRVKLKKFGRRLGETQAITCSMLQSSLDTHTTAATSLAAPAVHANGVTDFERHAVASLSTYLMLYIYSPVSPGRKKITRVVSLQHFFNGSAT